MTESVLLRRLEGIERLAAIGNEYYRGCFCTVSAIEVEGPLTDLLVQQAIDRVQQKFESLNVEIVQDPIHPQEWVFKRTSQKMNVEIIDRQYPEHWREIWNELANTQIHGLAWRILWVREPNSLNSHFIAHFHHAIFDGTSMAIFFTTLLQTLYRISEGIEDTSFFQPIPPAIHRATKARWPISALARIGYHHYAKKLRTLAFDPCGEAMESRRWHTTFRIVEKNPLDNLLKRCRKESITLSNAFSAAFLLEAAENIRQYEIKPFNLALCTTTDLRIHCRQESLLPLMGSMFSAIHSFYRPKTTQTLWQVARTVAKKIMRSKYRREDRNLSLLQKLISPKIFAKYVQINQGRPPNAALLITNIGRINLPDFGPFRPRTAFATAAQAVWGSTLFLGLATIQDRLCISLGYPFPSINHAIAEKFLNGILGRLESEDVKIQF